MIILKVALVPPPLFRLVDATPALATPVLVLLASQLIGGITKLDIDGVPEDLTVNIALLLPPAFGSVIVIVSPTTYPEPPVIELITT